jgi:hypothetical protein
MDELEKLLDTPYKAYVAVNADILADGTIRPRAFTWEDGERYEIDRVLGTCKAASLKAGGTGLRFTIRVEGKTTYLWLEDDCRGGKRFFMERRRARGAA